MEYEGNGNIGGNEAATQGTAVYTFEALSEESVTVPAGTFTAMKVKTDIALDVQITFQGNTIPSTSDFHMLIWWAPGVGLVKTETNAELSGTGYSETIELQSYNIP